MTSEIKRVAVLRGHESPETAYVVDDYPCGFRVRCKIRYWIETATKGAAKGRQRFVSQTTNPKAYGEQWNKPKASTYTQMAWMYLDEQGHVQWCGVDIQVSPLADARIRLMGIYDQMTESERRVYGVMVAMAKKYATPWDEFDEIVNAMAPWVEIAELTEVNGFWTSPDSGKRHYVGSGGPHTNLAVYVGMARLRATEIKGTEG